MRIVIVGPGALGCLLAARIFISLQLSGDSAVSRHSLYLLDYRQQRARVLARTGIILEDQAGVHRCAVNVTADPTTLSDVDVVFLCVKAPAIKGALTHIGPLLTGDTLIIGLQNGITPKEQFLAFNHQFVLGTTSQGATLLSSGHILHGGSGMTWLGLPEKADSLITDRLQTVAGILNNAGLQTSITSQINEYIQAKLFINVGINALTAIHGIKNGQLLEFAAIRAQMIQAVEEAVAVVRAQGLQIVGDPVEDALNVCRSTAKNTSSMLQDVMHKRPTEIDCINGAIVAAGRRLGVLTPVNQKLIQGVRDLEKTFLESE